MSAFPLKADPILGTGEPLTRGFSDPVAFWCLVTQIDTQAVRGVVSTGRKVLIGLVAEERIRRNHPFLKFEL